MLCCSMTIGPVIEKKNPEQRALFRILFMNIQIKLGRNSSSDSYYREERMRTTLERDSFSSRNSETDRPSDCA